MDAVAPAAVDFLRRTAAREDAVLAEIRQDVVRNRLPSITPEAGRTLQVLCRLAGVRRALEIGTCLGYSALWIARGLPRGGVLETVDLDAERSRRAAQWVRRGKPTGGVKFVVGDAHEVMKGLPRAAYGLVFIDADKEGMPDYLRSAKRLLRRGGILAADNVFWQGTAFDERDRSPGAPEVREFVRLATSDRDLEATIVPLGDGLLIARRR